MGRIDDLAADQRAVLQLLLKQGKTYDELARVLRMEPSAVRDRALAALDALGPRDGMPVSDDRRGEITDYLLGQATASERQSTRDYLEGSASGRAWARVVAGELRPLAAEDLPEVPGEGGGPAVAEPEEATFEPEEAAAEPEVYAPEPEAEREPSGAAPVVPPLEPEPEVPPTLPGAEREPAVVGPDGAPPAAPRSSRVTGAVLIAGVVIIIVAVIVIVSSTGGGGNSGNTGTLANTPPPKTTTTPAGTPPIVAQANLLAPDGSRGRLGVARILQSGGQFALELAAAGLPPSTARTAYGVWLSQGPDGNHFLGYPRTAVGRDGRLSFVTGVTAVNPLKYGGLLLTQEPNNGANTALPTKPGTIVLQGQFKKANGAGAGGSGPGSSSGG